MAMIDITAFGEQIREFSVDQVEGQYPKYTVEGAIKEHYDEIQRLQSRLDETANENSAMRILRDMADNKESIEFLEKQL